MQAVSGFQIGSRNQRYLPRRMTRRVYVPSVLESCRYVVLEDQNRGQGFSGEGCKRVIIRTSNTVPISRRVMRDLKGRGKQLRERLPDVDREMGLTCPVIDIVPRPHA